MSHYNIRSTLIMSLIVSRVGIMPSTSSCDGPDLSCPVADAFRNLSLVSIQEFVKGACGGRRTSTLYAPD